MFRSRHRAAFSAAIIATGGLTLFGCSSSPSSSTSTNAAPAASGGSQQADAYRQCLTQNGVKLPSGRPSGQPGGRPSGQPGGGGGGGGFGGGQSANPAFQKAAQACASLRPQGGMGGSANGGANASAIAAFTSCMKDHGVVLPSASPGSQGGAMRGLNTADAKTAKAYTTCQALLPQRSSGQPAPTASAS
jgi:hypothetical protein